MAGFLLQMIGIICGSSVTLLYFTMITVFQNLPAILGLLLSLLRGFLRVSFYCYRFVLSGISILIQQFLGIDILGGFWRVGSTTMLSLVLGVGGNLLLADSLHLWVIVFSLLHGLLVGTQWQGLGQTSGLRLGVDIQ